MSFLKLLQLFIIITFYLIKIPLPERKDMSRRGRFKVLTYICTHIFRFSVTKAILKILCSYCFPYLDSSHLFDFRHTGQFWTFPFIKKACTLATNPHIYFPLRIVPNVFNCNWQFHNKWIIVSDLISLCQRQKKKIKSNLTQCMNIQCQTNVTTKDNWLFHPSFWFWNNEFMTTWM